MTIDDYRLTTDNDNDNDNDNDIMCASFSLKTLCAGEKQSVFMCL